MLAAGRGRGRETLRLQQLCDQLSQVWAGSFRQLLPASRSVVRHKITWPEQASTDISKLPNLVPQYPSRLKNLCVPAQLHTPANTVAHACRSARGTGPPATLAFR